jgi:hypothetical protein
MGTHHLLAQDKSTFQTGIQPSRQVNDAASDPRAYWSPNNQLALRQDTGKQNIASIGKEVWEPGASGASL